MSWQRRIITPQTLIYNADYIEGFIMFNAADVLQPSFIEQPLDRLWALISPYYAVDESEWLAQLIPLATPSLQEHLDMD